jgi:V/A-type H+-transporting ATPase subunit F
MKSLLISDDKDIIVGLRLSGISGVLAESPEEINQIFDKAVTDNEVGIIIITENIFDTIKEKVLDIKQNRSTPLMVTIPDRGGLRDKNFIMKHIKESIGIKI